MKKRSIFILVLCYLSYTSIYIARLNLSMASPALIESDIMNKAQIGLLGSIFSVVYACGRLVNGSIGDWVMPWIMIASGLFLCGAGNLVISYFPPYAAMMILWGINAFAQSMLWSSILKIISGLTEGQTAKKITSAMVTSVAFGNIMGIIVNSALISRFGMRYAFLVPGCMTLFFCLMTACFLRGIGERKRGEKPRSVFGVLREKSIRAAILPAMMHGVMKDNISLWMTVYFVDKFVIDLNRSAYFVLFIPIIGFVGRTIYPLVYKLCGGREHVASVFGFVVCFLACIPLTLGIPSAVLAVICLSLIYAAVSVINTSFLSIFPMQFVKEGNVSSVSGIMDFATYLGAGIGSAIYGWSITKFGYEPMYASWAIFSVLSIFLMRTLIRAGTQNVSAQNNR